MNALDNLCKPSIIELRPNSFAAKYDLMKLVPAKYIIERAIAEGKLREGGIVVESSSGTFGIALAIVCASYKLKLLLITGPLSGLLRWRLQNMGVEVEMIVNPSGEDGGIQQDRINRLREVLRDNPSAFWTRQHENPLNPESYSCSLADQISSEVGVLDCLVISVGTGGSITGTSRKLRVGNSSLRVIAVDHNLSVLFGPTSDSVSELCRESYNSLLGMGADIVSQNLDHTQCDEVHWVPVSKMVETVHYIHKRYGVLVGPTGGAAHAVADWYAKANPGKRVFTVFPDHGVRYVDTIFNSHWLMKHNADLERKCSNPTTVGCPTKVGAGWERFSWARRTYKQILGHSPVPRSREQEKFSKMLLDRE